MGRYYSGDIEGKFRFGVQQSDDASFFGGEENHPSYLEYYFDETHKKSIEAGIAKCHGALRGYETKLADCLKNDALHSDRDVAAALGVSTQELQRLYVWCARLELGEKIRKCVGKNGSCSFEAEL